MWTTRRGAGRKFELLERHGGSEEEVQEMKKMIEDNRGMVQSMDIQKNLPELLERTCMAEARTSGKSCSCCQHPSRRRCVRGEDDKHGNQKCTNYGEASERAAHHRAPHISWSTALQRRNRKESTSCTRTALSSTMEDTTTMQKLKRC